MNNEISIVGDDGDVRFSVQALNNGGEFFNFWFTGELASFADIVSEATMLGTLEELPLLRKEGFFAIFSAGIFRMGQAIAKKLAFTGFLSGSVVLSKALVSTRAPIQAGAAFVARAIIRLEAKLRGGGVTNCHGLVVHRCNIAGPIHRHDSAAKMGFLSLGKRVWIQVGSVLGTGIKVAPQLALQPAEAVAQ